MSYGEKEARKSNSFKEWWGKRPYFGCTKGSNPGINKFYKRCTAKIERQEGKSIVNDELIEAKGKMIK